MNAPTLFDAPNVRPGDPDTSQAAAMPARVTLRDRVRSVLERNPDGLTDHELAGWLFPDPVVAARKKPTCGKRRQELGCIDTGVRRVSQDGMRCIVWRLPERAT